MPTPYHFLRTEWRFRAPVQRTWDVVLDIISYPAWWKNFRRVNVTRGDGRSVGSVVWCEVRAFLPYSLTYALEVVETIEYRHVLLRSTGGLVGTGRWEFAPVDATTSSAVYYWDVATTNPILNLVAPLAKGALARNHEQVMANGYSALRRQLEAG